MNKPKGLLIDKPITWKCCHERTIIFNFSNLNTKCSPLIFKKKRKKKLKEEIGEGRCGEGIILKQELCSFSSLLFYPLWKALAAFIFICNSKHRLFFSLHQKGLNKKELKMLKLAKGEYPKLAAENGFSFKYCVESKGCFFIWDYLWGSKMILT